ncbi:MAG: nucleotidyl transferase AbiEii/AbiGii toxin family protein [Gammaproteobacteria bacterium]
MSIYVPIFKALNEANVRYVVVGGVATVLHGYARFTADIDLVIDLDHEEAEKCINALLKTGLLPRLPVDPHQFTDAAMRKLWGDEKNMKVFSLWNPDDPLVSVDLFVNNPVNFEELWERADIVNLGEQSIRIASIPDLIALKKLANRPRDQEDIEQLQAIQKIKDLK